jgi:hypothetical protein
MSSAVSTSAATSRLVFLAVFAVIGDLLDRFVLQGARQRRRVGFQPALGDVTEAVAVSAWREDGLRDPIRSGDQMSQRLRLTKSGLIHI